MIILPIPTRKYTKRDFDAMSATLIYGWFRKGVGYLYIGRSSKGVGRFTSNHHVINVCDKFADSDEMHVWETPMNISWALETLLIHHLKPKHNKAYDPISDAIRFLEANGFTVRG
jgi:hypothetical protein